MAEPLSAAEYKALRESVGSQATVSVLLGVHKTTVADRERGAERITSEASLAMRYVALMFSRTAPEKTDESGREAGRKQSALRRGGRKALRGKGS